MKKEINIDFDDIVEEETNEKTIIVDSVGGTIDYFDDIISYEIYYHYSNEEKEELEEKPKINENYNDYYKLWLKDREKQIRELDREKRNFGYFYRKY